MIKMLLTQANVQMIILDATKKPGGVSWRQIKEAILREGMTPTNWLTQVRGPLQGLLNEGFVRRIDSDHESERYVATAKSD